MARTSSLLPDLDPQHHASILVLEVVAVKEIDLLALERVPEIDRNTHRLARPHEHGVLEAEIRRQAAPRIDCQRRKLIGARLPLEHAKLKAVQMHRMRRA